MSLSLSELQSNFALALRYQKSAQQCLVYSDHFTSDEHLQIYRNNFIISLCEILECTYPIVKALVGDECFSGIARKHILTTRHTQADVSEYGVGFDKTIQSVDTVHSTVPYLSEVARLESCIDQSIQTIFNTTALPINPPAHNLRSMDTALLDGTTLHLKPSVIPFSSHFAIFSIRDAVMSNCFDGLEIYEPEYGFVHTNQYGEARCQTVSIDTFRLMEMLAEPNTLQINNASTKTSLHELVDLELLSGFSEGR